MKALPPSFLCNSLVATTPSDNSRVPIFLASFVFTPRILNANKDEHPASGDFGVRKQTRLDLSRGMRKESEETRVVVLKSEFKARVTRDDVGGKIFLPKISST